MDHSKLENESGLVQLVKDVTHGKRILDKFLTNNSELFSIKTINSTIKTKHRAVLANCSAEMEHSAAKMTCRKTVSFPDSRAQHIAVLREALASYNWGAVHADGDDVDAAYNTFVCIIKELIKKCIPVQNCHCTRYRPMVCNSVGEKSSAETQLSIPPWLHK